MNCLNGNGFELEKAWNSMQIVAKTDELQQSWVWLRIGMYGRSVVEAVALNSCKFIVWNDDTSEFQFNCLASFRPNLIVAKWCVPHLLSSSCNDTFLDFLCIGANIKIFPFYPFISVHSVFVVRLCRHRRRLFRFFFSLFFFFFIPSVTIWFPFVTNAIA